MMFLNLNKQQIFKTILFLVFCFPLFGFPEKNPQLSLSQQNLPPSLGGGSTIGDGGSTSRECATTRWLKTKEVGWMEQ